MKRSLIDNDALSLSSPFDTIPREIKELIMVEFHHKVKHASIISKEWYSIINNYQSWFDVARKRYEELLSVYSNDCMIRVDCNRIFENTDTTCIQFARYVGMMMNSKYDIVCTLIKSNDASNSTPLIQSIASYIKTIHDNILAQKNFHRRDFYLNFMEEGHRYNLIVKEGNNFITVASNKDIDDNGDFSMDKEEPMSIIDAIVMNTNFRLLSVTTFIHSLFPHFDADKVIARMMANTRRWNNPHVNKYFGMSPDAIKAQWQFIGDSASAEGTAMHRNLEMYYTGRPYHTDTKEFALFQQFEKDHVTGKLRPYRTEWTMYSHRLQMCGSADIIYEYINDTDHDTSDCIIIPEERKKHVVLMDYKRSKEIKKYNNFEHDSSGIVACTRNAPNCNLCHYGIQQSLYKYILENEYDIIVDAMFLIVLHPNQDAYILEEIKWHEIKPLIEKIIQYRSESLLF